MHIFGPQKCLLKPKPGNLTKPLALIGGFVPPKICIKAEALIYKDKSFGFNRVFRTPKNVY